MSCTKTLVLYQPQNGYCYNSDTHFLYNFISLNLKEYKNIQGSLLDIGSGSGVLGLLMARDYQKLQLTQCEIQQEFQFLSQKNANANNIKAELLSGNFLETEFEKNFDYIVSNPPFYHTNVIKSENECLKIARYADSMPLEKMIQKVSSIISPKGKFFFCYDAKQLDNIVLNFNKYKLNIEAIQFLHPNESKTASLIMVYGRKGSKSPLKVLNPVIMFEQDGSFKNETNHIYNKCNTHSIKCIVEKEL